MDWLVTLGATATPGLLAIAGAALKRAVPRELTRARQLSAELEAMDADSPATRLVAAARDDLVAASVIRTTVTPWSLSRGIAFALFGAALTLAFIALIPLVFGLLATINGEPDDAAALLTLMLAGSSGVLLLVALIPARHSDRQLRELRRKVRAEWGLPNELKMNKFSDKIPTPRERPMKCRRCRPQR